MRAVTRCGREYRDVPQNSPQLHASAPSRRSCVGVITQCTASIGGRFRGHRPVRDCVRLATTRKAKNLRKNPLIAVVIGGWLPGDERTVQFEGVADEPTGSELERVKAAYYEVYPDGRSRATWPGLTHIRVRPTWVRYSDFNQNPPEVVEYRGDDLAGGS